MARIGRRVRAGRPRGPTPSSTAATTTGSAPADPRAGTRAGPPRGPGRARDRCGPAARGDGMPGRHPVDLGVKVRSVGRTENRDAAKGLPARRGSDET